MHEVSWASFWSTFWFSSLDAVSSVPIVPMMIPAQAAPRISISITKSTSYGVVGTMPGGPSTGASSSESENQ
eukprot:SAG22_NODE_942_length_6401_cov_9.094000_2_plen_72_part_00